MATIPQAVRRQVYELDQGRCVFCGTVVERGQGRYMRLVAKGRAVSEVVLAWPGCARKLEGRMPAEAGMMQLFGRFMAE